MDTNTTVTVKRLSATADTSQGPVAAWPAILSDWPAYVGDMGGRQELRGESYVWVQYKKVIMPDPAVIDPTLAVRNGDAIDVDDDVICRVTNNNVRKEQFSGEQTVTLSCEVISP